MIMAKLDFAEAAKRAIENVETYGRSFPEWVELLKDYKRHEWISVKERLPGLGEVLICTMGNWVGVAWHHGGGVFETGSMLRFTPNGALRVSYWMPLPEPPMEADHADAT